MKMGTNHTGMKFQVWATSTLRNAEVCVLYFLMSWAHCDLKSSLKIRKMYRINVQWFSFGWVFIFNFFTSLPSLSLPSFPHFTSHSWFRNSKGNLCDPLMVKFQTAMEVIWQSERRQIHCICKEGVHSLVLSLSFACCISNFSDFHG